MGQAAVGLRRVAAMRYVVPLREGGSLPGLVEADDLGTYVVKFRGAGQGTRALVAEVIVGELARRLGLPVPELVVVDLDPGLAPAEPDQEVQDLLRASPGENLGMDFLPGSLGLDVTVDPVDPTFAAQVLWLDALVQNVDRSWRNPNLLRWHREPWLIDHGAALYWHHVGPPEPDTYRRPYPGAADHVLLPVAGPLEVAHATLAPRLTRDLVDEVTALVPVSWLAHDAGSPVDVQRAAYSSVLLARVAEPQHWLDPVEVHRAQHV